MSESYFYEPAQGHGLPHDPFKAIVTPRPIGWISTLNTDSTINLAPYSFFNAVGTNPPAVAFSSEGVKDTLRNIEASGEFVANMATRALANSMNLSSAKLPYGVDEMAFAGIESAPSRLVKPPRVRASPAALECRLLQIVKIADLRGRPTKWHLVLGEVVGVHIDPNFITFDGLFDTAAANPIARCGYLGDYAEVRALFQMLRPR
jgi:flavin reductase (DIM6/NTAB) family NADH-FMN oxidoreductase RutF